MSTKVGTRPLIPTNSDESLHVGAMLLLTFPDFKNNWFNTLTGIFSNDYSHHRQFYYGGLLFYRLFPNKNTFSSKTNMLNIDFIKEEFTTETRIISKVIKLL